MSKSMQKPEINESRISAELPSKRYHECLDNLTPADVYFETEEGVKSRQDRFKQATTEERRRQRRQGF